MIITAESPWQTNPASTPDRTLHHVSILPAITSSRQPSQSGWPDSKHDGRPAASIRRRRRSAYRRQTIRARPASSVGNSPANTSSRAPRYAWRACSYCRPAARTFVRRNRRNRPRPAIGVEYRVQSQSVVGTLSPRLADLLCDRAQRRVRLPPESHGDAPQL